MFQNYEILFIAGTLGAIISLILLLIALMRNSRVLKVLSIILITVFVITFSTGIGLGYFIYENSKDLKNQVNENVIDSKVVNQKIEEPKITSGSIQDSVVITEKTFSVDDNYYYSDFEIKNNTNIEISKISFHIMFTYKDKQGNGAQDIHIFLLDSVIPPHKTVTKNYIWKKNVVEQALLIKDVKLIKIQDIVCYVDINGEEKSMKLDDLNTMLNNKK